MQRSPGGLIPIGEVIGELDVLVPAIPAAGRGITSPKPIR